MFANKTNRFKLEDVRINQPNTYAGLPRKGTIFRVHDDPERAADGYVFFSGKNWFLVAAELVESEELVGRVPNLYRAKLMQAVDRLGGSLVLVIGTSGDTSVSADLIEVMERAKTEWTERLADVQYGFVPRPEIVQQPHWPEASFEEVLNEAFSGDRYIDSLEHMVFQEVKRIKGRFNNAL